MTEAPVDPYRCYLDGKLPPAGRSWHYIHDQRIAELEAEVERLRAKLAVFYAVHPEAKT